MFRLLRYFSITSLISIAIASVALGVFYRHMAIRNLLELGQDHNIDMTRAFANTLWPQLAPVVKESLEIPPDHLQGLPQIPALHDAVYAQAKGLSVAKIKVYNTRGITVYSSEERQIGEDGSRNQGVRSALAGKVASELVYRDRFSAFEQTIERTNLISSYIPVRPQGSDRIEAVFELYDNVTPAVERIQRTQYLVVAGLLAVFGVLYGALFMIVRRADGILRRQAQELRQSVDSLRESQALLARTQYAVDHAADMVFWTDTDGRFIYVNDTSCRRLGYSRDELLGLTVADIDPNYPRESWPALWERLKQGGRMRVQTLHRSRSGDIYPAEVNVNYVTYGGAEFSCAFARDMTERQRAEAELVAAKEAAEAGARAKARFLANMGHELRTPLNGILGMTEVTLMEGGLSAEVRDNLETVRDSARALLGLITEVLEYSELESGKVTLAVASFQPRAVAEAELEAVRMRARDKGIALELTVADDVPAAVRGDQARLRQLLRHLLDNALKFTPAGSVTLALSAVGGGLGEAELRFTVTDTGVGISAEQRRQVFEAFAQGDASSTRRHGGAGLGLAICGYLARLMGGEIGVESEPGKGSSFSFSARFGVVSAEAA
ncbi:MAG TPA: ATP-binding protein [Burkholderiales bacterium]|nr:ATP-binding protein [Burkholderiales bacterium]